MLPNSVSYCRAKPFKVLAAAPRPREKGRFTVAVGASRLERFHEWALARQRNARFRLGTYPSLKPNPTNSRDLAASRRAACGRPWKQPRTGPDPRGGCACLSAGFPSIHATINRCPYENPISTVSSPCSGTVGSGIRYQHHANPHAIPMPDRPWVPTPQ